MAPKILFVLISLTSVAAVHGQSKTETHLTGVFQGKALFVQNPYDPETKRFCINEVTVNNKPQPVPLNRVAVKIDFDYMDLHTPVALRLKHGAGCRPVIINPDAIKYHSAFSFQSINFYDSTINWETKGEKGQGRFILERYNLGIWDQTDTLVSKGAYSGAEYHIFPQVEEGANKYRVRYEIPNGEYLYSNEIDFHYYPEPVTFSPSQTRGKIKLSRRATYKIYDAGGKMVLSGEGSSIDASALPPGNYVVYFNDKDPGVFDRLKN